MNTNGFWRKKKFFFISDLLSLGLRARPICSRGCAPMPACTPLSSRATARYNMSSKSCHKSRNRHIVKQFSFWLKDIQHFFLCFGYIKVVKKQGIYLICYIYMLIFIFLLLFRGRTTYLAKNLLTTCIYICI